MTSFYAAGLCIDFSFFFLSFFFCLRLVSPPPPFVIICIIRARSFIVIPFFPYLLNGKNKWIVVGFDFCIFSSCLVLKIVILSFSLLMRYFHNLVNQFVFLMERARGWGVESGMGEEVYDLSEQVKRLVLSVTPSPITFMSSYHFYVLFLVAD